MTLAMDNVASGYWSMKSATAFPGITFDGIKEHFEDLTTLDVPTFQVHRVRRFRVGKFVGALHRDDPTRTVDFTPGATSGFNAKQWKLISDILRSDAGEAIPDAARYESVLFLSKIPEGSALPSVSHGNGEIVFEWELDGGKSATASFEGDGFVGYAMLCGGKYLPGQADENLYGTPFPADLAEYLSGPTAK